jgi:hypothetical protein
MEQRKKIDNSLKERHGILRLLERLKNDNITIDEIEEIGVKLQKAGKRALSPLVRRLWRESSGDLITKYTYLLDFFEDDIWLDQLMLMALRRKDLEEEGKAAFLAALEGYGVDVTLPPFAALLAGSGGPLHMTLPKLLDKGEEGIICFVEDFLFAAPEMRLAIIRELPQVSDPRVATVVGLLLRIDDPPITAAAVGALGRIRDAKAVALLKGLHDSPDEAVRRLAGKSLRRLAFAGVEIGEGAPAVPPPLPFFATCASPVDAAGYRILWFCRWTAEDRLTSLFLQIHEAKGVKAAWGSSQLDREEGEKELAKVRFEEGGVVIPSAYALQLLRDAIFRSRQQEAFLPAEFIVRGGMFPAEEIAAASYTADFTGFNLPGAAELSRMVARSSALFDDDYFAGWFVACGRVYDFAEEWIELEKGSGGKILMQGMESLVERFCRELIVPEMESIRARLRVNADLMRFADRDRDLVEQTLAVALTLGNSGVAHHKHPFLKRFVLESMDMAREALAEGYDLRQHPYDEDDAEWE